MVFDIQLATRLSRSGDRDRAHFFAGREREIHVFETAIEEACHKPQAVFRIYQGAPGCGKTSLAAHLDAMHSENTLFVHLDIEDFRNATVLRDKIRNAATSRVGAAAKLGAAAADFAVLALTGVSTEHPMQDALLQFKQHDKTLVLHIDEAHAETARAGRSLRKLHHSGIGVPCIVMMTGLGHTKLCVSSIEGLSRLEDDAVVEMGTMERHECIESTHMMLDALNVTGELAERQALARLTGELAHGWPQHLHCAQKALCAELLHVNGVLRDVDHAKMQIASDDRRSAYYIARIQGHAMLAFDERLTMRIIADIADARFARHERAQLQRLCASAIERAGLSDQPEFGKRAGSVFAAALIEKGILSSASGQWELAIPSMAKWAASEIGHERRLH